MASDKFQRMTRALPSLYRPEVNTMIKGLLKAWAIGDEEIEIQLLNTKDQLFVKTANEARLGSLGNNVGVGRDIDLGLDDDGFRKLIPVMSFFPKQIRGTIVSLLDVFWGEGFTRPNLSSNTTETYNFGPASLAGGTANFKSGNNIVKGTGTTFLTTVAPGNYIKPTTEDGTFYAKVSAVLDDETLELSLPWEGSIAINQQVNIGPIRELLYEVDGEAERSIRFIPNAFSDITVVTVKELMDFINNSEEHSKDITASSLFDSQTGIKLNIRTNTTNLQGSIKFNGGDANTPARLNFDLDIQDDPRIRVLEVNPNELVIQIPSTVPALRRSLKGSAHPRQLKSEIISAGEPFNFDSLGVTSTLVVNIDGSPFVVNFDHALDFEDSSRATAAEVARIIDSQLLFLQARSDCINAGPGKVSLRTTDGSSEYQITGGNANNLLAFTTDLQQDPDIIEQDYPSAYLFDPVGQLYTVTSTKSELTSLIDEGTFRTSINLDDASSFPNTTGKFLLNFGRTNQEGPISYTSRPNNSTLLIDASHNFQKGHAPGRIVNFISNQPTIPRATGDDYPVFVVGTEAARKAAQELIRKLIAAGVVIRFVIDFPEFLFVCTCRGCGPSEDPEYRGAMTDDGPLEF